MLYPFWGGIISHLKPKKDPIRHIQVWLIPSRPPPPPPPHTHTHFCSAWATSAGWVQGGRGGLCMTLTGASAFFSPPSSAHVGSQSVPCRPSSASLSSSRRRLPSLNAQITYTWCNLPIRRHAHLPWGTVPALRMRTDAFRRLPEVVMMRNDGGAE